MGVMTQAVDVVTRQQAGVLTRDSLASLGDLQDLSPNSPLKYVHTSNKKLYSSFLMTKIIQTLGDRSFSIE